MLTCAGQLLLRKPAVKSRKPKKKTARKNLAGVPPELTETEADLLRDMQQGYELETSSLERGPLLRNRKTNEVVRPASANLNTVRALEERGLISPAKGGDPLTTIWRVNNSGKRIRGRK